MASNNKVVLVKRGTFGVGHTVLQVFDNRKVLTSWLPSSAIVKTPPKSPNATVHDELRQDVDTSFSDGTPLAYNPDYVVAKWLSGSIDDETVMVRLILNFDGLNQIEFGPFVGTKDLTSDVLKDKFSVSAKNLPRVRVVTSVEPFGDAAKAGFQVGDVLLHAVQKRGKTELLLESDKKPLLAELQRNSVLFVARCIPTPNAIVVAPSSGELPLRATVAVPYATSDESEREGSDPDDSTRAETEDIKSEDDLSIVDDAIAHFVVLARVSDEKDKDGDKDKDKDKDTKVTSGHTPDSSQQAETSSLGSHGKRCKDVKSRKHAPRSGGRGRADLGGAAKAIGDAAVNINPKPNEMFEPGAAQRIAELEAEVVSLKLAAERQSKMLDEVFDLLRDLQNNRSPSEE